MKVSKQQKILGAVLIVGLLAVASDQLFFLKSPSTVAAVEPSENFAVATAGVAPTVAAPASVSVAERLRAAGDAFENKRTRDAFALGAAWPAPVVATRHSETSPEQFRQAHRLTGAITSSANAHAMIDGKIVSVGETIDGYRLSSISHRSVSFESAQGDSVILNMTERSGGSLPASASIGP